MQWCGTQQHLGSEASRTLNAFKRTCPWSSAAGSSSAMARQAPRRRDRHTDRSSATGTRTSPPNQGRASGTEMTGLPCALRGVTRRARSAFDITSGRNPTSQRLPAALPGRRSPAAPPKIVARGQPRVLPHQPQCRERSMAATTGARLEMQIGRGHKINVGYRRHRHVRRRSAGHHYAVTDHHATKARVSSSCGRCNRQA